MAKTSVSTTLQQDTSFYGVYVSPSLRDESIYINPFYEGYIANPNIGGLTDTFVRTGGSDLYPAHRYAISRMSIQGGGGNDDYVVGNYASLNNAGTFTNNFNFGAINIATGGAGYNTFTWNNTDSYFAWSNASTNMVVSRNGNDLKIVFNGVGSNTTPYGTLSIQSWYDTSRDNKIEKFTFNSGASHQTFVRSAGEMESLAAGKTITDASLSGFLSTSAKSVTTALHVSGIDLDSISSSISGGYIGNSGGAVIAAKAVLADRSVSGELKFWSVITDGIYTKAVQILLKDTNTGIDVTELQARYTTGDKTDGSFNFNSQGNGQSLATGQTSAGYGATNLSFSGVASATVTPPPVPVTADTHITNSISGFISKTGSLIVTPLHVAQIQDWSLAAAIAGDSIVSNNDRKPIGTINGSSMWIDRSVNGELKYWVVGIDDHTTKGVQILLKDTDTGITVTVLQAKSSDGYFQVNYNTGGDVQSVVDSPLQHGFGIKGFVFEGDTSIPLFHSVSGGAGNDTFTVTNATDVIVEAANAGIDTVNASVTYTLGDNLENLNLTGTAAINGTGNALNNVIVGNAANNVLNGGAGDDTIDGSFGNNTIYGGLGNDTIIGGAGYANFYDGGDGNDTVDYSNNNAVVGAILSADSGWGLYSSGGGAYTYFQNGVDWGRKDNFVSIENLIGSRYGDALVGNAEANRIDGGAGDDSIYGKGGNDALFGGDGNDTLDGGTGNNTIYGGKDNDTIIGGAGYTNFYDGGDGNDTVDYSNNDAIVGAILSADSGWGLYSSGGGAYTYFQNGVDWGRKDNFVSIENLIGSRYGDVLVGNAEANRLDGGAGDDNINGGEGNDVLIGGFGNDTLQGGSGADTFVFNATLGSSNIDKITDFTVAQSDRIALDHNIFTKLVGVTDLSNYFTSTSASKATDYIQYNKSTGELSYDFDGNGAGVAQVFAVLTNKPTDLVASSFTVI
jgi:Ca2+-binding RTX toxin-like protein